MFVKFNNILIINLKSRLLSCLLTVRSCYSYVLCAYSIVLVSISEQFVKDYYRQECVQAGSVNLLFTSYTKMNLTKVVYSLKKNKTYFEGLLFFSTSELHINNMLGLFVVWVWSVIFV